MTAQTILLVDDERTIRELGSLILTKAGYEVLTAEDGLDGMMVFERAQDRISLVLTDIQMPKADGLALATAVKNINPDVKIIFMSGYAATEKVAAAVVNWKSSFLQKPFSLEKLKDSVNGVYATAASA
ncbi:MAG: multi-sensor hybrid histidine kinase [Fibrobacteres bacterium]|nr:multi-sensor hybrid histidine kinase [Fibrobacterota bacterium]